MNSISLGCSLILESVSCISSFLEYGRSSRDSSNFLGIGALGQLLSSKLSMARNLRSIPAIYLVDTGTTWSGCIRSCCRSDCLHWNLLSQILFLRDFQIAANSPCLLRSFSTQSMGATVYPMIRFECGRNIALFYSQQDR